MTARGGENSKKRPAAPVVPATNSQGADGQVSVITALVGTWQITSQKDENLDVFSYSTMAFDQNGNKNHQIFTFSDSNCKDLLATLSETTQVQFEQASTTIAGAQETIENVTQATITPASDAGASRWASSFSQDANISCKSAKFRSGVTTNMTSCIQALGVTVYSLLKLNGSQLQFGDCSGNGVCKSAATRATTIDSDLIYTTVN